MGLNGKRVALTLILFTSLIGREVAIGQVLLVLFTLVVHLFAEPLSQ